MPESKREASQVAQLATELESSKPGAAAVLYILAASIEMGWDEFMAHYVLPYSNVLSLCLECMEGMRDDA